MKPSRACPTHLNTPRAAAWFAKTLPLMFLAGLVLTAGCNSFGHAWNTATGHPTDGQSLAGRWEGSWSSDADGHSGRLRCFVTPEANGTYKARFHAIYKKVIGFGYTVPLSVVETNGGFQFSGDANLGWWAGGIYHYEGLVQTTNFSSTYRCRYDHGTFHMTRPAQPGHL